MDNQLLQEINITLGAGFQQLAASLRRLEQHFGQYGQQANRAGQQTQRTNRTMRQTARNADQAGQAVRRMGGGISNIQAGLVQLSNYLLILNQRITNTFANMTKRFTNAEDAMTQLKITLGLGGKTRALDPRAFAEFEESTQLINKLAATTQFTKKEVANAFTELVQSGRQLQESNKLIASTLQMATASGGMIDLKEATEIATLSIGTLGAKVEEVPDVLNMLVRLSQKTRVGFTDLRSVMESLGSSFVNLGDEGVKRSTALMVMAAALRALGDQGRGAGHHVGQFFRTMTGIQTVLARGKLRFEAGLGGKGRMNLKREALVQLFGVDRISQDELVRATDGVVKIGENYTKRLQDEFVKRQFLRPLGGGKYAKLESVELMRNIANAYFRLQGEVGADAEHIITRAFGQKAGIEMLQGIIRFADQAGVKVDKAADHFANSIKVMMTNEKDLMRATEESQKTLSYRLKVLDSAYDNLSNTIYKHDLVNKDAVDTHKEIVSAVGVLMEKNEGLASSVALLGRGLQFLSGVGANVGFTLVAAATFSHGLNMAMRGTSVAAAGLGGTLRAFGTMFLAPTLTVALQFTGALALVSLGLLAMVRYLGGENLTTAQAFANVLERIKNMAKSVGGMLNLVFSDKYGNQGVASLVQDFYKGTDRLREIRRLLDDPILPRGNADALIAEYNRVERRLSNLKGVMKEPGYEGLYALQGTTTPMVLARIVDVLREAFIGLKTIAESAIGPMLVGVEYGLKAIKVALIIMLTPFKVLAQILGFASDESSALTFALKALGFIIGSLGAMVVFKTALRSIGMGLGFVRTTVLGARDGLLRFGQSALSLPNIHPSIDRLTASLRQNAAASWQASSNAGMLGLRLAGVSNPRIFDDLSRLRDRSVQVGTTLGRIATEATRASMAIGSVGLLLTMTGNESAVAWGNVLMTVALIVPALLQLGQVLMATIIPAMIRLVAVTVATLGVFGTVVSAFLVILGIGYLIVDMLFGVDKAVKRASTSSMYGGSPTTRSDYEGALGTFGGAQASVTPRSFSPTAGGGSFTTPVQTTSARTTNTNNYDNRITVRNLTIRANKPVELGRNIAREAGMHTGSDFAMASYG